MNIISAQQLYHNPHIQRRIYEYCGGTTPKNLTCAYISRCDVDHKL